MLYCKNHQSNFVPETIQTDLKRFKYVFNPSFVFYENIQYWAFRCYSENKKEILAVIYIYHEQSLTFKVYDLNPIFKERYDLKPADPKLLRIGDKIYCTLNTGYSAKIQNSVFLIQITDKLDIKRCNIRKRSMVEKNWAFFEQNGQLKMLYSVSPICKIYALSSVNEDEFLFEPEVEINNSIGSLTIGTQPVVNNGKMYLIGHRKYSLLNKRLYLGVPIIIDMKTWLVKKGSVFLVHSLGSMFGSRFRFNRNLISCTYFSGLQINFEQQQAQLTYGVNDVAWNSVAFGVKDLWE